MKLKMKLKKKRRKINTYISLDYVMKWRKSLHEMLDAKYEIRDTLHGIRTTEY